MDNRFLANGPDVHAYRTIIAPSTFRTQRPGERFLTVQSALVPLH